MKSLGPHTWALPAPAWLVGSYGEDGSPNIMTAAWGGVCASDPPSVYVALRESRKSYENISARKAYTVSIAGEELVSEVDYAGLVSGREADKFLDTELTPVKAEHVDAPYVKECPLVLECRLTHDVEVGSHRVLVGEVVDVKADEDILTDGKPDIQKIKPIVFSPPDSGYHGIGVRLMDAFTQRRPTRLQ